jgi:hypothetical protein
MYQIAVKRVERIMTKVIGLFYHCSDPKVFMLPSSTNTPAATGLSMLTYLTPATVSTAALSPTFSKSCRHKFYPSCCFYAAGIAAASGSLSP